MGLLKWIGKRAKERSTYVGVSLVVTGVATAIGKPEVATEIVPVLDVLTPILLTLGGVFIGKPKAEEQPGLPFNR